jgi:integrase
MKSGKIWVGYYYNGRDEAGNRKEIPLGGDLNFARLKWAELEKCDLPNDVGIVRVIFDRYRREILPLKAPKTQKLNIGEMRRLLLVFGDVHINSITPQHIAIYRDKRGRSAPVAANRELALFSHIFNFARECGYTSKENPVSGVRKNKENPRDYYADDVVWRAVYSCACQELKDAMDLAYLTGQRPSEVTAMRWSDIQDGALLVRPGKTRNSSGKKLRIVVRSRGALAQLLDSIKARGLGSAYIVSTPDGRGLTQTMRRDRFDDARAAAADAAEKRGDVDFAARVRAFQFRDIRPKAASEIELGHASKLLGHTKEKITRDVYRRRGEEVDPAK